MNVIVLQGRLTSDPEVRTVSGGSTCTEFSLAVPRKYNRDETDFFRCTAWNKKGELISEHLSKGDGIIIQGILRQEKWKDKEGNNRETVGIVVEEISFPAGRSGGPSGSPVASPSSSEETDKLMEALTSID